MDWLTNNPNVQIAAVMCVIHIVAIATWWMLGKKLLGLTLRIPWVWGFVPLCCLPFVEISLAARPDASAAHVSAWRFLAALTLLCPTMALLGAKRPQHKAWSFIVAAFWIVLALPALRVLVIPGGRFQLDGFRMLLTGVLCGISVINYLFSSRVGAVILLVTQVFFLYGQFPELVEGPWQCNLVLFVMDVLLLIGCVVAHRIVPRSPVAAETGMAGLEVAWRDFYRLFGVIWSLRVADQINATARRNSWDMVLHGSGFDVADPVAVDELTQVCANLLRRFVSTQWLAARVQITDDGSS